MSPRPSRAPLLLALVWLAGAVVATSIGVLAVRQVASEVGDPAVPPLSTQAAAGATASGAPATRSSAPATTRAPTSPARPPAVTTSGAFRSAAGTVGVQCTGTTARLLYATPADGYALDEQSASGSELEVRFEAGETKVRLELTCASGKPVLVNERVEGDDD